MWQRGYRTWTWRHWYTRDSYGGHVIGGSAVACSGRSARSKGDRQRNSGVSIKDIVKSHVHSIDSINQPKKLNILSLVTRAPCSYEVGRVIHLAMVALVIVLTSSERRGRTLWNESSPQDSHIAPDYFQAEIPAY